MNRRPSGVTLSAVVLGIFDIFLLIGGLMYVFLAILLVRSPDLMAGAATNGAPPPPAGLLVGMMGFFAFMALLCFAWGLTTFVGLLRMKNWARVSIIVIGVCLAALSLFQLFCCVLVQVMLASGALPQNPNSANLTTTSPAAMQGVFLICDAMCLAVAAIGIWWIVYFARRKTRAAFESVKLHTTLTNTAQLNPAGPITDFSVAQPMEPAYVLAAQPAAVAPPAETVQEAPGRPVSMIIVAVLALLGSASLALCCVLPYPLFLFGVQIGGAAKYLLLVAMSLVYAVAGFGLLQRKYFGWLAAVGMYLFGLVNILVLLTPSVRARYMAFMQSATRSMTPAMPNASQTSAQLVLQQKMMNVIMVPVLGLSCLFVLFILVLLWRARWWYKSSE